MVITAANSDDVPAVNSNVVKFLCSYGGKILPRYPDGKLRYVGGETRVLALDRSVPFSELIVKLGELCGSPVCLRCQLPTEDLDALVSVTCDEDVGNLIEEYDRASRERAAPLKIRAFLLPPKSSSAKNSPPETPPASARSSASALRSPYYPAVDRHMHRICTSPVRFPVRFEKSAPNLRYYACYPSGNPKNSNIYLVHNGNHWQQP